MKSWQRLLGVAFFAAAVLTQSSQAYAQSAVRSPDYWTRMPARFGYGFLNTVFGWTALVKAPAEAHQAGLPGAEAFSRAMVYPFSYTVLGIWDLGTFWVPGPGEFGREMAVPRHIFMPTAERALVPVQAAGPA